MNQYKIVFRCSRFFAALPFKAKFYTGDECAEHTNQIIRGYERKCHGFAE